MSTVPVTRPAVLFNLSDCRHVTATVETRNSQYVVVSRSYGTGANYRVVVTVVCTRGTFAGTTFTGDYLWMRPVAGNGGLCLTKDGDPVLHTTEIVAITVHEN